ncbi:unnamed protein product, partial [Rotaria sordida]
MVRKKSAAAKAKTRKEAYKRQVALSRISRSWRKLLLIATAVNKFLRFRHCNVAPACSTSCLNTSQSSKILLNNVSFVQKDIEFILINKTDATNQLEDLKIVQATIKSLVCKVCRVDYERKRQLQVRKRNYLPNPITSSETSVLKCSRQYVWFQKKYCNDDLFRKKETKRVAKNFRSKYTNNNDFRDKEKTRLRTYGLKKYRNNATFRQEKITQLKAHIFNKYHTNMKFRNKYKIKKRQMPSRAIVNKLELCEVPSELKKLNNLEKHLIALQLPFMKIINLTSGKLSSRLAQKGTKGPLHCVPSDVQDTVTTLPRPVDKSMMV